MSTTLAAAIALATLLVWGTSPNAAPPGPDPEPVLECPDIAGHLTATPSSIDRETSTSLTTTLVWSVDVPKRCPESPIVTLERRTVPLSGQLTVGILRTTTFVLRLESEHRDLARATVTVQGDPGFITVSLGRQIAAEDIAKFNAQWMQPASIKQALDFATWTLQNRDPDGVWGTGERMAAMVRMFALTQDTRYLDHLQDLIQVALKYRDDLPLDRDRPDLIRLTDQIRNKVGLAAWGGPGVDYGGLHHVDEIVSSLYAYPIAAFARIVAGHPPLQVRYGCDSLSGKTCRDAIDYTNYVRETVGVFLPQIRRQRVGGFIEAKLTHPVEYRNRPTAADCDKAYEDAKKADPGNLARWDQKHSDCNLLRDLAGQALPHNINLTFSMVLIELSRVLDTPFHLQSPRHSAGAENMRDQILVLISRQQRYLVNHLNPGALKDQYSACERNFCWYYMGERGVGPHELIECIAQTNRVIDLSHRIGNIGIEGGQMELTAALLRPAFADIVDDQSAHRSRRVREETLAIRKHDAAARHVQVALVQKRRGAERRAGAASSKLPSGETVQFLVQRGEQRLRRCGIATLGGDDQVGNRRDVGRNIGGHVG